ncbi:hypothetical protein RND71_034770 [Anisodus tanguticus]|uniref:Uncharacterized protein n=1 Tax=Anisodus tanguticus TaxID=243964 RepID=A0AAE1R2V1_9SOLA|nr:hypothetical protein RND71_034770 [Anisodus tanguticus]
METLVPENMACIKSCNDLSNFELSQENRALLMSLLDETQALDDHEHYHDDKRLTSVIRSLEIEIDQRTMKGHDLFQENNQGVANFEYNWQSCDDQSQKNSESNGIGEFNWMEIEMENFLYMETSNKDEHEVDGVSEYCYGVCLEENNYDSFLWEEQYPQH